MYTFFKFFCVGVLNTALDFAVLNICIFFFGTGTNGELFAFFKSISFLIAVANSYVLNRRWVFEHDATIGVKEPALFFLISFVGFWINVSLSFAVFTFLAQTTSVQLAANAGALAGTAVVLAWNFVGYRFFVFNKSHA